MVDGFSKYAIFVPSSNEWPFEQAVSIFLSNSLKYFGMPQDIECDLDMWLTGKFWLKLFKIVGVGECNFFIAN